MAGLVRFGGLSDLAVWRVDPSFGAELFIIEFFEEEEIVSANLPLFLI